MPLVKPILMIPKVEKMDKTVVTETENESEDESASENDDDPNNTIKTNSGKRDPNLPSTSGLNGGGGSTKSPTKPKDSGKIKEVKIPVKLNSKTKTEALYEKVLCKFYQNGRCKKSGEECRFLHPKICRKFNQFGDKSSSVKGNIFKPLKTNSIPYYYHYKSNPA